MTLSSPNNTLSAIQTKVRRLTASASEQILSTDNINEAINTFYQNDFPYAIKLDQMRGVYTFFTSPNVDRYPVAVNVNQGIRSPIYFEGIKGYFFKDRGEFFNMWPRWPTLSNQSLTPITGTITGASNTNPCVIQSVNTLANGTQITISGVGGMTEINGLNFTIANRTDTEFELSGIDATGYGLYTTGGTWSTTQIFSFTIQTVPFLPKEVAMGVQNNDGTQIRVGDDGNGNLYVEVPNLVVLQAPSSETDPIPGMKNRNLSNLVNFPPPENPDDPIIRYQTFPGDIVPVQVGTIDYVTGDVYIDFTSASVSPASGSLMSVWVSQYTPGRPYSLLFWNNEFTVRPVPDKTYKVEVETYMTPVQLLENDSIPLLVQHWQYIAYGAAMEILRERQDVEGLENLREGFMRQESLVLERQGVEEIGQRNATIFSSTTPQGGWNQGSGWPY